MPPLSTHLRQMRPPQLQTRLRVLRNLKEQLIDLAPEAEDSIIEDRGPLRRGTITWHSIHGRNSIPQPY